MRQRLYYYVEVVVRFDVVHAHEPRYVFPIEQIPRHLRLLVQLCDLCLAHAWVHHEFNVVQ